MLRKEWQTEMRTRCGKFPKAAVCPVRRHLARKTLVCEGIFGVTTFARSITNMV